MRRISENAVINTKNKSHAVTAEIEVPAADANGVIVAQGGSMGGWSLYAYKGKLKYYYNFLGMLHFEVASTTSLKTGLYQVRMEFTYDGGGIGKGVLFHCISTAKRMVKATLTVHTPCFFRWMKRWK
jgi:hypothetical protein